MQRATARGVPVAGAAWAAAAFAIHHDEFASWASVALWSVSAIAGAMAFASRHRGVWIVSAVACAAAAAAVASVALAAPARSAVQSLAAEGARVLTIEAVVSGKVQSRPDGAVRFDAIVLDARNGEARVTGAATIRVDAAAAEAFDVGAIVRLRATAVAAAPGDRAALAARAIDPIDVTRVPGGFLAVASDLRHGLVAASAGLPGPGAGLVPGLAVGDTSAVDASLDAAMKVTSLSHLTAVSGANCALVVGLAYAAAAALGARRRMRVAWAAAALAGFVVLVTPEPSVVRAATMSAIAMVSVLLGRPGSGLALLSSAVAVLLIADPWLASSLGFALSVAATAALLVLSRPLALGLARGMPRALALALAVPLAAQLACGPLILLIEPTVALYGVVANMLAAPAAPAATVLGLAACLAAPVPVLRDGLAALAWLPASWIAQTALFASDLPASSVSWLGGWPGALLLAGVGTAIGMLVITPRHRRWMRAIAGTVTAGAVGVAAGAGALTGVAASWTLPPAWSIVVCDVGQGDAILLRSAGRVALVDTGADSALLQSCLAGAGVDRIDLLVLTHFDADHAGAVDVVSGRVGTVVHGPGGDEVIARLVERGARAASASGGMSGALGDATWRVLWPGAGAAGFGPGNDASVVVEVTGGGIPSIVLLGDLSASAQRAVRASAVLRAHYDVVKVAHHGSADQDATLYERLSGAVAVISVGAQNTYGHPRDELLAVLAATSRRVVRTDLHGAIALWRSEAGVDVWHERVGDRG